MVQKQAQPTPIACVIFIKILAKIIINQQFFNINYYKEF